MEILSRLNSPVMYIICGSIVLFVAIVCIVFAVRAYRAGKAIGMDVAKMKRTIIASATFAVLPSVGILLGVIALSGSLGTPWPWLRLSVIGALHYETQVAEAAAEQTGLTSLSASQMTPEAFSTIALVMSTCIMWGMVLAFFHCKTYTKKLSKPAERDAGQETKEDSAAGQETAEAGPEKPTKKKKLDLSGFGDKAMTAMFIGLVSAYIGSYIGSLISGEGIFTFKGSAIPLAVAIVGAAAMALFQYLRNRFKAEWLDSFSIAGSMLCAMTAAIFLARIL
ncbi:MAG: DUF5058 family protein [Firmicutes bacterium]|nr:DUF5058 family protein [Bacillota bacterium]